MTNGVLIVASAAAVVSPAVGILYFPDRRRSFRAWLCLGLMAVLLAAFAGAARHLAPNSADPVALLTFGPVEMALLGSSFGANLVALAVLVLGLAGAVPHHPSRQYLIALSALLCSPALLAIPVLGAHMLSLALLPLGVLVLVTFVRVPRPVGGPLAPTRALRRTDPRSART